MRELKTSITRFWRDDDGQDFVEYTLMMAFVALFSVALYSSSSSSISQIWSTSNNTLSMAAVSGS